MTPPPAALPHAEDAERAVLGAFLIEPTLLDEHASRLAPELFYLDKHRQIFEAMSKLHAESGLDILTLQFELLGRGALEKVGGAAYLAKLDLELSGLAAVAGYIDLLATCLARRRIVAAASEAVRGALDHDADLGAVLTAAQKGLDAAEDTKRPERLIRAPELMAKTVERLRSREPGSALGLSTGFRAIDEITNGLQRGHLWYVAGRPGHGKTCLMLQMLTAAAQEDAGGCAALSLEMAEDELAWRLLAEHSGLDHNKIRAARLSSVELTEITHAAGRLGSLPFAVDDTPTLTPREIAARARQLHAKDNLRVLFVDYIGLVAHHYERGWNTAKAVGETSRQLKLVARSLEITVVCLSQLSRKTETRAENRPQLSDLRESGDLEQDADVVLFLHRPELYDQGNPSLQGKAEFIFAKVRHGRGQLVRQVYFDGARQRFLEREPHRTPPVDQRDLYG